MNSAGPSVATSRCMSLTPIYVTISQASVPARTRCGWRSGRPSSPGGEPTGSQRIDQCVLRAGQLVRHTDQYDKALTWVVDDLDRQLIGLLRANARLPVATLAKRLKVAR